MNFDEIVVKESPGICRCCLSEGCYKDLGADYTWMNETEVYADMLLDCFDIGITQHNDGPNGAKRLICEVCITRLRDACNFKKQVVDSEKRFIDMLGRGEFRPKVVIYQPQGPMKVESAEETAEDVLAGDIEYLEDMDFGGDEEEIKTEALQSTSAAIVTEATPQPRPKRGRPKKEEDRSDKVKKQKISKDDKPEPNLVPQVVSIQQRKKNLEILFNHTTVVPFKRRQLILCFFCGVPKKTRQELIDHNQTHLPCSMEHESLEGLKGTEFIITADVSEVRCKICQKEFQNIEYLEFHMAQKHELPYALNAKIKFIQLRLIDLKYTVCHDDLQNSEALVKNTHKEHTVSCLECNDCGKQLGVKDRLKCSHKDVYSCYKYSKNVKSRTDYANHRRRDQTLHCILCGKAFASMEMCIRHVKTGHDIANGGTCRFCCKKLDSKDGLVGHVKICSLQKTKPEVVEIRPVSNIIALRDAKQNTRKTIAYIFNSTTLRPFKTYHNRFRCFYCEEESSSCNDIRKHTIAEHPVCDVNLKAMELKGLGRKFWIKVDTSVLDCKLCQSRFDDWKSLIAHLETGHGAKLDGCLEKFHPFKLIEEKYPCPGCGREFSFFPHLLNHFNKEHTLKRHLCGYCGETLHSLASLNYHMSLKHMSTDRYKCSQCGSGFHTRGLLMKHQGSAHGTKVFKCGHCDELFVNEYLRRRHEITKHGGGHQCKHCGVTFVTHYLKTCHVKRRHLMEKNEKCGICDKTFYNKVRLGVHMAVHIGKKNFACQYCEKRFSWKKGLMSHMKVHKVNVSLMPNAISQ